MIKVDEAQVGVPARAIRWDARLPGVPAVAASVDREWQVVAYDRRPRMGFIAKDNIRAETVAEVRLGA